MPGRSGSLARRLAAASRTGIGSPGAAGAGLLQNDDATRQICRRIGQLPVISLSSRRRAVL
jgi:hypothetical protein